MSVDPSSEAGVAGDMERIFPAGVRRTRAAETVVPAGGAAPAWRMVSRRVVLVAAPVTTLLALGFIAVQVGGTFPAGSGVEPARAGAPPTAAAPTPTAAPAVPGGEAGSRAADEGEAPPEAFATEDEVIATEVEPGERAVRMQVTTASTEPGARTAGTGLRCRPGSTEDACIYQDVTDADLRLRRAYDAAIGAGVPAEDLALIRRRWDRALDLSLDAPDETIRRYDRFAAELRRATAERLAEAE